MRNIDRNADLNVDHNGVLLVQAEQGSKVGLHAATAHNGQGILAGQR